jgi:hypothetical protein
LQLRPNGFESVLNVFYFITIPIQGTPSACFMAVFGERIEIFVGIPLALGP